MCVGLRCSLGYWLESVCAPLGFLCAGLPSLLLILQSTCKPKNPSVLSKSCSSCLSALLLCAPSITFSSGITPGWANPHTSLSELGESWCVWVRTSLMLHWAGLWWVLNPPFAVLLLSWAYLAFSDCVLNTSPMLKAVDLLSPSQPRWQSIKIFPHLWAAQLNCCALGLACSVKAVLGVWGCWGQFISGMCPLSPATGHTPVSPCWLCGTSAQLLLFYCNSSSTSTEEWAHPAAVQLERDCW